MELDEDASVIYGLEFNVSFKLNFSNLNFVLQLIISEYSNSTNYSLNLLRFHGRKICFEKTPKGSYV